MSKLVWLFRKLWLAPALFVLFLPVARAQQPNTSASPSQEPPALDNPVLDDADEDRVVSDMQSRVALKFAHDNFDPTSLDDFVRLAWFQSYGEQRRFLTAIEIPWINFDEGNGGASGNALGDIKVAARVLLFKTASFDNALEVEFTLPSASNDAISARQTIFRGLWGFSRQITPKTLLSGNVGYNRGFHAQPDAPVVNEIEPELILTQELAKRFAVYADYDTFYSFHRQQFGQTMELGVSILLNRKESWEFEPFYKFPLNQFTRSFFKNAAGFELTFYY